MKFFQKILVFLLLAVFLTGAVRANANALSMITQVRITCKRENTAVTRVYVQPHKIQAVLNYLRLLECGGKTDADPEHITGDSFEIILYSTDGQCSIYRQRANQYFSKNAQPWKKIPTEQASLLYPILRSLPSDKQGAL